MAALTDADKWQEMIKEFVNTTQSPMHQTIADPAALVLPPLTICGAYRNHLPDSKARCSRCRRPRPC